MAEHKIFAGPRIRRIRNGHGPDPDGHGRGARHLAVLSQPDRAQPAAADRAADPQAGLGLQGRSRRSCRARPAARSAALQRGLRRSAAGRRTAGRPGTGRDRRGARRTPRPACSSSTAPIASRRSGCPISPSCWRARAARRALSGARLPIDEVHEVFERRPNHFRRDRGRRPRPSPRVLDAGRRSARRA